MLENNKIDAKNLQQKVEQTLKKHSANADIGENKRGEFYKIKTNEATLEITIGKQWIGYELHVDKSVLGKEIGTSEDTDLHPIYENAEISLSIFDQTLTCLKGLLEDEIYVGTIKGKPSLAVPVDETYYKLVVREGRFSGRTYKIGKSELGQIEQRRPLK